MAYDEEIFLFGIVAQEFLEVFVGCAGGQRGGAEDLGLVAGLSAYEGGGL
jgi:hypothetical protein